MGAGPKSSGKRSGGSITTGDANCIRSRSRRLESHAVAAPRWTTAADVLARHERAPESRGHGPRGIAAGRIAHAAGAIRAPSKAFPLRIRRLMSDPSGDGADSRRNSAPAGA